MICKSLRSRRISLYSRRARSMPPSRMAVYHENVKRNKLVDKRAEISVEYELCAGKGESQKAAGLKAKLDELSRNTW